MDKPIKIAIVEDNDFDYELEIRKLKSIGLSYEARRAFDENEFIAILNEFSPDLILSDFSLPTFSGMEALKIAKKICPDVPFIFVSGTIGEELAVETLKQGAIDYVIKDNLNKLYPAITRAINETKERIKRREAEEKLLIKINELKTLVYRISHDIRGPICTIKGALNLINNIKSTNPAECFEYVNLIEKVASKLDGIVLNLNSFYFVYTNEIKPCKISLLKFVDDIKCSLKTTEDFTKVSIDFKINQNNDFVSEPKLLTTIFYNILHNSIIFSDASKEQRKVGITIESSGSTLRAEIEDNGIGIPYGIKDKIFDMFYRGSSLSKGAGLGLYLTKNILDKLNGIIKIESKERIGTKVLIEIPTL